jgi:hypothetical protein
VAVAIDSPAATSKSFQKGEVAEERIMTDEDTVEARHGRAHRNMHGGAHAGGGAVYGLGLIGAAVYYIQHATGFGDGLLGLLKAIVWPAFLVYQAMAALKM